MMADETKVIYKYRVLGIPFLDEEPNLEEALFRSFAGSEENEEYCYEIVDGKQVYTREDMQRFWSKMGWT